MDDNFIQTNGEIPRHAIAARIMTAVVDQQSAWQPVGVLRMLGILDQHFGVVMLIRTRVKSEMLKYRSSP